MQWYITDSKGMANVISFLASAEQPYLVTFSKERDRSSAQNRLVHKWFTEISKHRGDTTPADVKAECNLKFGLPILRRDSSVAQYVIEKAIDPLPYAKKLTFIKSGVMAITSQMSVEQLREYMDEIEAECREQGITLTQPET
jgi:hypothetical protein